MGMNRTGSPAGLGSGRRKGVVSLTALRTSNPRSSPIRKAHAACWWRLAADDAGFLGHTLVGSVKPLEINENDSLLALRFV